MQYTFRRFIVEFPSSESVSFRNYLLKNRFNKISIGGCILILLVQFCLFKYYYPDPAFINGDSYVYLTMAYHNLKIDTYPVGYSRFLRLFSVFSSNDTSLIAFQYFFIQLSALFLLFSLFYFHRISCFLRILLIVAVVINPVVLYLSNYVSSDSVFLGLTLCWFTSLIWIMNRPTVKIVIMHAFILLFAFMVRYNALFYPIVSLVAFFSNREKLIVKVVGFLLFSLFISSFIAITSWRFKQLAGKYQFSPFSGWQIANNAMYAYRFVDSTNRVKLANKFDDLDNEVRLYFDTTKKVLKEYPEVMLDVSAMYMWTPSSPLRTFMNMGYKDDSATSELKRWAKVAPLYKDYGSELIRKYPGSFLKNYIWPNFIKYYIPPEEFLGTYGFNVDTINLVAKSWFGYKKDKVHSRFKDITVKSIWYYPILCGVMNAVFIMMVLSFLILKGWKVDRSLFKLMLVSLFFWSLNLGFSVFASPIALRFQIFPLLLTVCLNFFLLSYILDQARNDHSQGTIN